MKILYIYVTGRLELSIKYLRTQFQIKGPISKFSLHFIISRVGKSFQLKQIMTINKAREGS